MASVELLRALLRHRTNLFQSFLQPVVLMWILSAALGANFGANPTGADTLREFLLSFSASEFYAAVILLVTIMVASQYATDMAVQCVGPHSALRPRIQYRSPLGSSLSIAAAIVQLVAISVLVFLAVSQLLNGVLWPWASPAFWVLLGGLILVSVMGGFALGLATENREFSDLLISLLIFGSALASGAFFPYPASSRIWLLAEVNPFTPVLIRMLELMRGVSPMPGSLEYLVWICALGLTGVAIQQLWHLRKGTRGGAVRSSRIKIQSEFVTWVGRRQPVLVCSLGILILPLAIWLAGPSDYVPSSLSGAAGPMYPYAGLTTVLLFLLSVLLVSPTVDGPVHIRNRESFRRWFLWGRAALGVGLVLVSGMFALTVWQASLPTLAYTVLSLSLFHIWSLALVVLIADTTRDKAVYWAVSITCVLLISFLGGSLWPPALFGSLGRLVSFAVPNGLLLHHASLSGLLVVIAQIGALTLLGSPKVRQSFRWRRRAPVEITAPHRVDSLSGPNHMPPPTRKQGGMVDTLVLRERKRILDEVHDTLGHGVTGALWQIRSARGMTQDPAIQAILDRAAEGLEQGLARVRNYLRDSAPRRSSDWSELYAAIEQFSHCPVELSLKGDAVAFHPLVIKRFTQTIQELLTNALRYGDPEVIHIDLIQTVRFHRLEYRERGRGWGSAGPRMGFGLSAVQSLFAEIGGSFHLEHLPDARGIQVIGIIPAHATSRPTTGKTQEEHRNERQKDDPHSPGR